MEKLSIKINIAKRSYPLSVNVDELEVMREAEKLVNETLANFEHTFKVSSPQDLLAMCAFQLALANIGKRNLEEGTSEQEVAAVVDHINTLLDEIEIKK